MAGDPTSVRSKPDPPTNRKRGIFLSAPLLRALLESGLLGALGLVSLLANGERLGERTLGQAIFFLMPVVALWYAVRLRIPKRGSFWCHAFHEIAATLALSPLIVGIWIGLIWLLGLYAVLDATLFGSVGAILVLLASGPMFLILRGGVRVWQFWDRLRRHRLVWALTHTQLQLVLFLLTLGAMVIALGLVASAGRYLTSLDTWVYTVLPFMGLAGVATLIGLAAILPPALFLAWLTARRTTRRLDTLTEGTAALRRGDYGTRIAVEGEDEVAQLQWDFNTMAEALDQAMRDLQTERDRVAGLLASRRHLIAGVSHELRTPLATVRGYLEALQHTAEGDLTEQALQRDLDVMERELIRLQSLIDDLFTLSRAEVDALTLNLEPVDVGALMGQRVEAMGPLAAQRDRLQIVADIPDSLPAAKADATRVEQVLVNLIRNAVRHTPPGGIIALSAEEDGDEIQIQVCDTGEGIPPEEQAHIWQRFYRGENARTQDRQGAGLGLSLVKDLVRAMGGRVAVASEVGQGSCFCIWLPKA